MEAAGLWVAIVAACAALAGAVFAYVQAKAATDTLDDARTARDDAQRARDESVRLAGEANAAFVRQAEAQEEANRIAREARREPDWTVSRSGFSWRVANTSGQPIHVLSLGVSPMIAFDLLRVDSHFHPDMRYDEGEVLSFNLMEVDQMPVEKVSIHYRYESARPGNVLVLHVPV